MECAQVCPLSSFEKLLLAVDMSEFSEGAISEAISLARKCSSKLYVIAVLETNIEFETMGYQAFQRKEKEAVRYLESVKERASKEGLSCEVVLRKGEKLYQFIIDEAVEKKVDIIVIGRRKGLAKLLMGDFTAKVIGNAPCNVLVVPKAARIEYGKILVATDGSEHSDAAVAEAIGIAKRCGSRILALSVMRDEIGKAEAAANVNKVIELVKKEGVENEAIMSFGRPSDVIVETAGDKGVDLIIMGTYGKTGIRKMLMGSATEKVIGNVGCAVLVVRAKKG